MMSFCSGGASLDSARTSRKEARRKASFSLGLRSFQSETSAMRPAAVGAQVAFEEMEGPFLALARASGLHRATGFTLLD